jgi:hypothetical protein
VVRTVNHDNGGAFASIVKAQRCLRSILLSMLTSLHRLNDDNAFRLHVSRVHDPIAGRVGSGSRPREDVTNAHSPLPS